MSGVRTVTVAEDDDGLRLDRWFKKHFPHVSHGRLQKLLRTGQVRLDGGRVKSHSRVICGQLVRVPPIDKGGSERHAGKSAVSLDNDRTADLHRRVLYRDAEVLVIDKPAGLAVQGGSRTVEHLDAYLDELRFEMDERPRLVHRLDKDTSGVLALARTAKAARWLSAAFRQRETRKLYWAIVAGVPTPETGVIDAPVGKRGNGSTEKMYVVERGEGKRASSVYQVIARIGDAAAWLAMEPLTGRTHQLRVHAAQVLQTPVLGDGKYGGGAAFLEAKGISRDLHLHARGIRVVRPRGRPVEVFAPIPAHMSEAFRFLGFTLDQGQDVFLEP